MPLSAGIDALWPLPRAAKRFRSDDLDEVHAFVARAAGSHSRVAHRSGAIGFEQRWVNGVAVAVGVVGTNVGMTTRGSMPACIVHVAQPAGTEYRLGRRRHVLDAGAMMLVPAGWNYTMKRPAGRSFALAVDPAQLAVEVDARRPSAARKPVPQARVIPVGKLATSGLADAIVEHAHAFDRAVARTDLAGVESRLTGALAALLLDEDPGVRGTWVSDSRLASLESWIESHLHEPITVGRLCALAGVGDRALQRNFLSRRGMSPLRFVVERRLDEVRRRLVAAGPTDTVTRIALSLGFVHVGRFSVLYREVFGESPVATLRRARR